MMRMQCLLTTLVLLSICCAGLAQDSKPNGDTESSGQASVDDDSSRTGVLTPPWSKSPVPPESPRIGRITAKELLRMYGIDESQLARFFDERPLDPDETETLLKVLYRMPFFRPLDIEHWVVKQPEWKAVVEAPRANRARFFSLAGRVKRVETVVLPPESQTVLAFTQYYRVKLELDSSPFEALICARRIPAAWPMDQAIDEPTRLNALFLKVGDVSSTRQLVFAADRVPWFPDRVDEEAGIEASQVALAQAGFDGSYFEDLRKRNRKRFNKQERESFYQMLAATSRLDHEQKKTAAKPLDIGSVLLEPEKFHGELYSFRGGLSHHDDSGAGRDSQADGSRPLLPTRSVLPARKPGHSCWKEEKRKGSASGNSQRVSDRVLRCELAWRNF